MYLFKTGEIREVGIEVVSKTGQQFTIDAADYSIITASGVVSTGIPTIDGTAVKTLFHADNPGKYTVNMTYTIGPEKFIAQLNVEVS